MIVVFLAPDGPRERSDAVGRCQVNLDRGLRLILLPLQKCPEHFLALVARECLLAALQSLAEKFFEVGPEAGQCRFSRHRGAIEVEPFLCRLEPCPSRQVGAEVHFLPFGVTRRLPKRGELGKEGADKSCRSLIPRVMLRPVVHGHHNRGRQCVDGFILAD